MQRRLTAREVVTRLFLFGLLTSFGYLLYSAFLTHVSAPILMLNTFTWFFILQAVRFEKRGIWVRSPFRVVRAALSSHLVGYALCQFAYWYLFWSAGSILSATPAAKEGGGTNFAPLALAFLSVSTLATPIAMHYAKGDQKGSQSVAPFIALALPLALSIVLIDLDMSWKEFSQRLSFLDGIDWSAVSLKLYSPVLLVCVCLAVAVLAEAVGDFLIARKAVLTRVTRKQFNERLDIATFAGREVDEFIQRTPVDHLLLIIIPACHRELKQADAAHTETIALFRELPNTQLDDLRRSEYEHSLQRRRQETEGPLQAAECRLDDALSYQKEAATASAARCVELKGLISRDYWGEIYDHVEKRLDATARVKESKEAAADLMAVLGIFLSLLLLAVEFARVDSSISLPSVPLLGILALLGLTGSSARQLCLLPLLETNEAQAEALFPPIYAVRPLFYLALGYLLLNVFGIGDWIQVNVPLPSNVDILPRAEATYKIGAFLAVCSAACAWAIAYFRSRPAVAAKED